MGGYAESTKTTYLTYFVSMVGTQDIFPLFNTILVFFQNMDYCT